MKNNKGFTLVEVLAVISIIGVVAILLIPTLIDVFYQSKKMLDEYTIKDLKDAGKMYITDIDMGVIEYTYNGEKTIDIEGTEYKPGDKMTGYDFRVYAVQNNGINVSIKDLVSGGYFDSRCNYEERPKDCKVKDTCVLKLTINSELVENEKYYVSNGYEAELLNGCE